MTEVAFLFTFGWGLPVHGVVLGEGLGGVTLEAGSIILLLFRVVPVERHSGSGAFRCHEKKDEDSRTGGEENDCLYFFVHIFSVNYLPGSNLGVMRKRAYNAVNYRSRRGISER